MRYIVLLFVLFTTLLTAQEKKYQGLLWEVSGNGLEKNSYLYGSMHVSDKISYHLSDAFFKHLLEADMVANESEPSTWIDVMGLMGNSGGYGYQKLYAQFYLLPATKQDLFSLFYTKNFTLNNLLFRTNEYEKEYQEETYLDMFIYRTGRKYSKTTVGLEDTKQSLLNMMDMDYDAMKPKEENIVAMQRILKNTNYQEALMNYYREKDLDMLDSLTTLASGQAYLKALLYDRNKVFVQSIDSLVKKGSLFAAVGAAHLPGKKGLIELLRAKGYTVKPVADRYTDAGKAKKEMIESYFKKPDFETYTSTDGIITLPVFKGAVIEDGTDIQSPDLTNGGYINVKRLLLNDYLKKDNKPFNHQSLDSLFYENIPGKILEKKFYTKDGYSVYDIKNTTKTGNAQHYRYYITPLEIIMVSMSGERDYVKKFEDVVYNNITLKSPGQNWQAINPEKGVFSAYMPDYTVLYGESVKNPTAGDIALFGYDEAEKANYFVIERTLDDAEIMEDTGFELKRMHYEFYNQLDADTTNTVLYTTKPEAFTSSSKIGSKEIKLKSLIKGPKYYLLGSVGASTEKTQAFFNSFAFAEPVNSNDYRTYADTAAHYTVKVPRKENEALDFQPKMLSNNYNYGSESKNVFKEQFSNREIVLPSGQKINLYYHKYHRYHTIQNVDTIWQTVKNYMTAFNDREEQPEYEELYGTSAEMAGIDNYNNAASRLWNDTMERNRLSIKLTAEKKAHDEKAGFYTFEGLAMADKSNQARKFKALYRNGEVYLLYTLVDRNYTSNPDIETVFGSFTVTENTEKEKLPKDRLQVFIEDANSEHDSIRSSAMASVNQLVVTKENLPQLERFMRSFNFKKDEISTLTRLYDILGDTKEPSVLPFLEQQYKREDTNTIIQFAVLEALTGFETEEAYTKIGELLEYDLPVSDKKFEVANLFAKFKQDTRHSAILFPDILQYYSIPEYQKPIVSFVAQLIEDDVIKPKKLKSYKKMLLTNTRLEIKREKSRLASRESNGNNYYSGSRSGDLSDYMELLYPFRNDKDVKAVFKNIRALDMEDTKLEMATLDIRSGNINETEINALLANPETLFKVLGVLTANRQTSYLKNIADEQIAQSAVLTIAKLNTEKDSLSLISKKTVAFNDKQITFYFYKIEDISDDENDDYMYGYAPTANRLTAIAFINKGERINPLAYKHIGVNRILDDSEIEENINTMIDKTLNANRQRASFGKVSDNNGEMEEYIDF
ncbi:TraB/GumN family protein [Flavobacterium rhizosphaerae]|uniref:TraB/GumN family protein n=1 Tax=Flavobacterium rhizosphaerae TaxID=3163298 RepID=A0ABW8Z0Y3_9FLAO